jgi:hypothetical protein
MGIFGELVDNGLSGCILVVMVYELKWGHFLGLLCAAQCASGWIVELVRKASEIARNGKLDDISLIYVDIALYPAVAHMRNWFSG